MAGINFVRRWVMGQMTKKADDGIMITLPDSSKVDLNVNITMDRLLRNGIDPDAFTNPQQVDNAINMINSRMVERVIPANSAEGREITEKLFGKQKAPVFDLEGNRIPEGSGIMGGKSVKELMDSGQVTKGARGMKKSKKVEDREMFEGANKRLTSDVDSIINNIKSMEPITAMKEANSVIGRKGKYKNLTPEQSKKILQDTEDHIFERNIPEEDFAKGGRAGFAGGGSDASTTSYSKSYDKQHGTNTASRANKSVDRRQAAGQRDADNTNRRMEANRQAGLSEIFAPKETIREKIENSRFNNPITRGLFRAGLYATNPSLGILDARQAMQLKNAYDLAVTGSLPNTDTEETLDDIGGLTSNLITDQQKGIIDKQGNMGKLTGAFDPDSTFDAAKQFDDKGSSGVFGIGGRDAEPMTREEFDNYVQEKGYATGGRAGFMAGGMGRRAFLKLMGGTGATIGAAKSGIFSGFGKGAGKEVAKEVVKQSATTPPPYFFKLAEKIKKLGSDTTPTNDRTIAKSLKSKDGKSDYILEEDVTSGDTIIKKVNKEGDEMITDVEIMEFRKGEVVKGKDGKAMKTPDEYEEVTEANARIEGDVFNDPYYSDGIEIDDILREVDDIPVPKASGGIARMLGE